MSSFLERGARLAAPLGKGAGPQPLSRRSLLKTGATAAMLGAFAPHGLAQAAIGLAPTKKLKLAWMPTALCHIAAPVALHRGFFEKYNLDVETINWAGSTDLLLQAVSTGKADFALGMALRCIKPLEGGFDVKLTGATHGGCMHILAGPGAEFRGIESLKGKRIGVGDIAGVDKNFFAIALYKLGINPNTDVEWRQFPADFLGAAVLKGEVDVISTGDPIAYKLQKNQGLVEVANNLTGEYANRNCCVIGVRGSLLREDPRTAAAATRALVEAAQWAHENPEDAANAYAQYAPKETPEDLAKMLRSVTSDHHPTGEDFKTEMQAYADELKLVDVLKARTDTKQLVDRVVVNVLA
jgi:NitT/TauT family transport system substrate-binding protein